MKRKRLHFTRLTCIASVKKAAAWIPLQRLIGGNESLPTFSRRGGRLSNTFSSIDAVPNRPVESPVALNLAQCTLKTSTPALRLNGSEVAGLRSLGNIFDWLLVSPDLTAWEVLGHLRSQISWSFKSCDMHILPISTNRPRWILGVTSCRNVLRVWVDYEGQNIGPRSCTNFDQPSDLYVPAVDRPYEDARGLVFYYQICDERIKIAKKCASVYYFYSQNELLHSIWGLTPWFNGWRHALKAGVHCNSRHPISFLQATLYCLNYLQIFWRQIALSLKAEIRRLKKGKRGQESPVGLQRQNHCYFYQTESSYSGIKKELF